MVNENKLKIILTNEDMDLLDLTYEEMAANYYEDAGTKRILWEIIENAKNQTGFDSGLEKPSVVVYPEKGGGCFVHVTKEIKDSQNKINEAYTPYTYEKKYKSKLYTSVKKKRILYMFENSETLFEVCRQLTLTGYTGKSDIFADKNNYYLCIEDNREKSLELIGEYGILINNPMFGFYLDEHTKKIISSDAVKKFAEVFS